MNESQPIPPPQPTVPAPSTSSEIRTWSVLCHASALLGLFFHFLGHLLGPLIVWLIKRDVSPEIDANGKESLNFQISMLIYDAIAAILCLVLIGIPILIALWVLNTVFVIIASVKTSEGKFYRYPFTIRFIN
ncbi:MAG TPA: DUF4870 domain-containing protein [Chthoniobacterales bacterium]|nr:DUF4870 domain-containing protein [Chthoniobacterales bacterium]